MKNPVMIEGIDDTRSYDERSLNQWVERCIRENFVNSEGLVLCPHKSDVYFDPKKLGSTGTYKAPFRMLCASSKLGLNRTLFLRGFR